MSSFGLLVVTAIMCVAGKTICMVTVSQILISCHGFSFIAMLRTLILYSGTIMFLLPIIPGVPVYLTLGTHHLVCIECWCAITDYSRIVFSQALCSRLRVTKHSVGTLFEWKCRLSQMNVSHVWLFPCTGWVGSAIYSIVIGLLLKLYSSAIQQKIIGERLSLYVRVRQFVGINSTLMRAMRLVVGVDGLPVSKVAILIGGPDWVWTCICTVNGAGMW
jgi:hypothetical protein